VLKRHTNVLLHEARTVLTHASNTERKCADTTDTVPFPGLAGSNFYRAMLCIRGTSPGPVSIGPSVCPSVTSRYSIETVERIELVFGK